MRIRELIKNKINDKDVVLILEHITSYTYSALINHDEDELSNQQIAEYNKSVKAAHEAKEEYQKLMADNVSEENVKMITDKHELQEAEKIYKENLTLVVAH